MVDHPPEAEEVEEEEEEDLQWGEEEDLVVDEDVEDAMAAVEDAMAVEDVVAAVEDAMAAEEVAEEEDAVVAVGVDAVEWAVVQRLLLNPIDTRVFL